MVGHIPAFPATSPPVQARQAGPARHPTPWCCCSGTLGPAAPRRHWDVAFRRLPPWCWCWCWFTAPLPPPPPPPSPSPWLTRPQPPAFVCYRDNCADLATGNCTRAYDELSVRPPPPRDGSLAMARCACHGLTRPGPAIMEPWRTNYRPMATWRSLQPSLTTTCLADCRLRHADLREDPHGQDHHPRGNLHPTSDVHPFTHFSP